MRKKGSLLVFISNTKAMVNIRNCTFAILILAGLSMIFAIVVIMVPDPFDRMFPRARESIAALSTAAMVFATLLLAYGTFRMIHNRNAQEKRDSKESILNEIRDWIFSIKDITLEPITEENIAFRQLNIELKYGIPMSRVELLKIEIKKILKDQDLNEKVSKVAKLLAAVMVLDKAKYKSGNINEDVIEAFPGYVNFIKEILNETDEEANKIGKSKEVVAYDMWKKYAKKLNNAEAEVLDKIVSLKSDLLKP